jgi:hypothetical protein
MKLVDLVSYFRQGGTFDDFCKAHKLNAESEVIEVYAQKPVSLESQLGFFPIEDTKGQVEYFSDGAKYQNLFDFFYFLEVIEDVKSEETPPKDAELAQTLLSYALNDS